MLTFDFLKLAKSREHRMAWLVAIAADALQVGAFPFFVEGGFSPADTILDVAVGAVLCRLLGWHWAFLPTIAAELVPGLDLFPTWTAAVFYVTRSQAGSDAATAPADARPENRSPANPLPRSPKEPEILPPGPAPARRP